MKDKIIRSALGLLPSNEISGLEEFRLKHIHHPGKDIPFHVTLMYQFYLPYEIDGEVEKKLSDIASTIQRFEFVAHPLSTFPTTCVLYMTPSPSGPFERINDILNKVFPEFDNGKCGYPLYHMTIASDYDDEKIVVAEFIETFGYKSLDMTAGSLVANCVSSSKT